jgi:hypothetical protein
MDAHELGGEDGGGRALTDGQDGRVKALLSR